MKKAEASHGQNIVSSVMERRGAFAEHEGSRMFFGLAPFLDVMAASLGLARVSCD